MGHRRLLSSDLNAPEGLILDDRTNALLVDELAADLNADRDNDDDYASDPDYSDHQVRLFVVSIEGWRCAF